MAAAQEGGGGARGGLIDRLDRVSAWIDNALVWGAALILGAMMLFSVADMVARGAGITIAGSYEVIGWMSAAAVALALGSVQRHKGHVAMDLFVVRLAHGRRALVDAAMAGISFVLFVVVSVTVFRYAVVLHETGSMSETLRVIVYPWVYGVGVGCIGLALALFVDLLRALAALRTTAQA